MVSLDSVEINEDLVHLIEGAFDKRDRYLKRYIEHEAAKKYSPKGDTISQIEIQLHNKEISTEEFTASDHLQ